MDRLIEIRPREAFKMGEARALLLVVFRLTKGYSEKVAQLLKRMESMGQRSERSAGDATADIESQINALILEWQGKVERLGGLPRGLWIADFDAGDGYYCWKYPEQTIGHWHRYADGFSKRVTIADREQAIASAAGLPSADGASAVDGQTPSAPSAIVTELRPLSELRSKSSQGSGSASTVKAGSESVINGEIAN